MSTHQESPPPPNQTPPETQDAKPDNDPKAIEPPPPKPDDDSKTFNDPKATEPPQPKPDDDSKTFNDPKATEPPQPKPDDDSKTFNDPKATEPPQPKPDNDSKTFNDPKATEPPQPNHDDDSKTFNDPKAIEPPPPKSNDDPKNLKDPNAIGTPPPKPDDDSKTFNDPKAIEPPPSKPDDDPKNLKDPNAIETPPPKPDDDSKILEGPNANETPPPKTDESLKDPNATDDPKTLKDPKANETLPSENQPIAEVAETLKKVTATDADPPASPLDKKPSEILPADDDDPTSKQQSLPKNDFPKTISNADPEKLSLWKKVREKILKRKNSHHEPNIESKFDRLPSMLKKAIEGDVKLAEKGSQVLSKYQKQLEELLKVSEKLEKRQSEVSQKLEKRLSDVSKKLEAKEDKESSRDELGELQHELHDLQEDLIKLRLQITLKYKVDDKGSFKNFHFNSKSKQTVPQEVLAMMPQLHNVPFFKTSPEFEDFEARYDNLDPKLKLCLLCFSIFPEKAVIRKRVMVQWWVSEGFALEKDANDYFIQLIEKGFIEPVAGNRSLLVVGSCKMHPFYRSALVMLAERAKFLNFNSKGGTTQNFSESFRASLVGEGLISYEDYEAKPTAAVGDLEKVHLVINIKEAVLEFKKDWFGKMKSLNYLYLGKWEAEAAGHREVDDTVFLDELKHMSYLKFLSLQGVSNMISLPESVLKLQNLEILDIRACHNLETIPERIGSLKWLTHLDVSECFLIERMPKGISSLRELRVLKGFVVGEDTRTGKKKKNKTCTLGDLKKLTKLVKLCIYTGLSEFPENNDVEDLGKLPGLKKLTITWGGNAFRSGDGDGREEGESLNTDGGGVKDGSLKTDGGGVKDGSLKTDGGGEKDGSLKTGGGGAKGGSLKTDRGGAKDGSLKTDGGGAKDGSFKTDRGGAKDGSLKTDGGGVKDGSLKTDRGGAKDGSLKTDRGGAKDGSLKTDGGGAKDGSLKMDGLFPCLDKLDLRYFPKSKTPDWLAVGKGEGLNGRLKNLYVRAGKFSDIGQYQESDRWEWPVVEKDTWKKVEVLRLRYLPEIEMEWRQVQELFPSLVYLEQVGCPRLTLFPCDANGVWIKSNHDDC